ncbi:MAG TPA: ABC transporter permease [Polyangiaceae bacterium]|nr:ABC transporter permease [Polyangiaceae bacterium]
MAELTQSGSGRPARLSDRISGPPSGRFSLPPGVPAPPPDPTFVEAVGARVSGFLVHLGRISTIFFQALTAMFRRPFEFRAIAYQMESLGVRSVGIASVTAIFIGMVMAVQFAFGLQKFGGMEYTGRVVGLSFARELAPTLTAVIVGGRIGSGMTAEVGSMAVTEQIDAIYALGADPIKKLVVPRLIASVLVLPILGIFSLVLGFSGAMIVTATQFNVSAGFFLKTALDTLTMGDFLSGVCKCPVFGAIIALVGCYFGLVTTGGTEGVGKSTTRSVVVISITILIADFFLTKIYMFIWSL